MGWVFGDVEVVKVKTEHDKVTLVFVSGILKEIRTVDIDIRCYEYDDYCNIEEYDDLHDSVKLKEAEDLVDAILDNLEEGCKKKCEIDFSS